MRLDETRHFHSNSAATRQIWDHTGLPNQIFGCHQAEVDVEPDGQEVDSRGLAFPDPTPLAGPSHIFGSSPSQQCSVLRRFREDTFRRISSIQRPKRSPARRINPIRAKQTDPTLAASPSRGGPATNGFDKHRTVPVHPLKCEPADSKPLRSAVAPLHKTCPLVRTCDWHPHEVPVPKSPFESTIDSAQNGTADLKTRSDTCRAVHIHGTRQLALCTSQ